MTQPFSQVDPFTQVYRQLWELLEGEALFTRHVPPGNRIKYDGSDRHPDKQKTSTADFPEVRIVITGGTANLVWTSTNTLVEQNYQVQVATGDQRFTVALMPIKWSLLKAMAKTKDCPTNLGLDFVLDVEANLNNDFDTDLEGRERDMWVGVFDILVRMQFDTAKQMQGA